MRKYDSKVPYIAGIKELRPFIGVLFMIGQVEYFAPLWGSKPKHKILKILLTYKKIDEGNYGVINFNNMIPVTKNNYVKFDLNSQQVNKKEKSDILSDFFVYSKVSTDTAAVTTASDIPPTVSRI